VALDCCCEDFVAFTVGDVREVGALKVQPAFVEISECFSFIPMLHECFHQFSDAFFEVIEHLLPGFCQVFLVTVYPELESVTVVPKDCVRLGCLRSVLAVSANDCKEVGSFAFECLFHPSSKSSQVLVASVVSYRCILL
jgi:hypothetical protein